MDGYRKGGGGGLGCSSSRCFATFHQLCHPLEATNLLWAHSALCLQINPAPCTGLGSAGRGVHRRGRTRLPLGLTLDLLGPSLCHEGGGRSGPSAGVPEGSGASPTRHRGAKFPLIQGSEVTWTTGYSPFDCDAVPEGALMHF